MRKFLIIAMVLAAFVSCSKSDDDTEQQSVRNDYPCRFNEFWTANGNPEITYGIISRSTPESRLHNDSCRQISFQYNIDEHTDVTYTSYDKLLLSFFNKLEVSDYGTTATNDRVFSVALKNGDMLFGDTRQTKESHIIKMRFQCIHLN